MIRYYFAGPYSRSAELRAYRDELERVVRDSTVTSRWIDLPATVAGPGLDQSWKFGQDDQDDLDEATVIVSFTGDGGGGNGGRYIEHAIVFARNKRLVVVGPWENIFRPGTEVYGSWSEFLAHEPGDSEERHREFT